MMKDEYIILGKKLKVKCASCEQFGHTVLTCAKIHFTKSKELVVRRFNFSVPHSREKKIRKRKMKSNSLH